MALIQVVNQGLRIPPSYPVLSSTYGFLGRHSYLPPCSWGRKNTEDVSVDYVQNWHTSLPIVFHSWKLSRMVWQPWRCASHITLQHRSSQKEFSELMSSSCGTFIIPTFELSPFSQAVPSQCLSTVSIQGLGHCCPVHNLSTGNLCARTSHWAAINFLKAALQSDVLLTHSPVFLSPFSLVRSASWVEGSPCLLLLRLPFLVHRAQHPQ